MDETPEELEQIRREAAAIDPYQYRKRGRLVGALALGMLGAALVWGVLELKERKRNPCERVRDHFCAQGARTPACVSYEGIFKDSIEEPSAQMRSNLRAQCETKIKRLKEEDGVTVR
jgi:hypothetical protein